MRLTARLRHALRQNQDHGMYSLELAVIFLLAVALLMSIVQASLWFYSRDVAITAARQGVEAARAQNAGLADGTAAAGRSLDRFGGTFNDHQVSTSGSTAGRIRITVRGSIATLVPGWTLTVSQSAEGPREQWSN